MYTEFDFSMFSDSLLAQSHSLTCWHNKLESSAMRWKSRAGAEELKSFIYNRNCNSPKTESCGTPCHFR